jgi:hypothetical protein
MAKDLYMMRVIQTKKTRAKRWRGSFLELGDYLPREVFEDVMPIVNTTSKESVGPKGSSQDLGGHEARAGKPLVFKNGDF